MEPQTETSTISGWFDKNNALKIIFENSTVPIFLVKCGTNEIISINKQLLLILGYKAEDTPSLSIPSLIYDSNTFIQNLNKNIEDGTQPEVIISAAIINSDGNIIPSKIKVGKIADKDSEILFLIVCTEKPITTDKSSDEISEEIKKIKSEVENQLSLKAGELNKQDDRFSLILEKIPSLVIALDEDNKLLYVNSKLEKYLGYSLLDISRTGFDSKVYDEDVNKYTELISNVETNPSMVIKLVSKDGNIVETGIKATSFYLQDGSKARLLVIDPDYNSNPALEQYESKIQKIESSRKNLDFKLDDFRQMLELSNSVLENSPNIILVYDNTGKLIKYSKNSDILKQFSFEELSSIQNLPVISKNDRSEFLQNVLSENFKHSSSLEIKLTDKNEKEYASILNIRKILDDEGNRNYTLLYFTDISKFRMGFDDEGSYYNVSFDNYPDMILLHDIEGNIIDVNKTSVEKLGFSKKELKEKKISDLGLHVDFGTIDKDESDAFPKLRLVSRLESKDGEELDVKVESKLIGASGRKVVMSILKETTVQKQRNMENRLLESSLGQLLQFMNVGIIIFNHEGYITHLSSNCEALSGIKGEAWNESAPFLVDKIVREDFIIFRQNFERVFKGEALKDILIGFKNNEEKKNELMGSFLPVMEEEGVVSEVILILKEYTPLDKERRDNTFYETILNNAPIGIITFDPSGNYTSVNEEFLKMLAYEFTREEVLGWNLYSLMDKDKILPGFITALKGETVDYTRDYMPTPSNQKYSFYQSFAPLKDKDGNIIGVLGLLSEITDKSIIPQNIIEAEEKYRKIFDSLDDCILLIKPSGRIINANRGSFTLLGEPITDIVKNNFIDYVLDSESEEFADFMFNLHSFGNASIVTKLKKEDGSLINTFIYGKGLEISGLQHFFVVIRKHEDIIEEMDVSKETASIHKLETQIPRESNGIDSFNFLKEFDEGILITDSGIYETIFINEKIKEMFGVSLEDFQSKGIMPIVTEKMSENSKYFFHKNIELCRSSQLGIKPFEVEFPENDDIPQNIKIEIFNFTSKILGKELKYIKLTPVKNIKFQEDEEESIKNRYYKYFEYLPLPCVIINSEGVILDLNPLFNEALQYGYSDMINKKLELFFAQDSERITSFLKYHKNFQQLNEQNDLKIKRRDGSLVDCRIFYTKIEDDIFLVFLHLTNLQRYLTGTSVNKEADFSNRLSSIQEITGEISMGFSSFIYLIDGYTEFLTKSRDLTQIEKQRLNQLLSLISKIHSFIEKLLIFSERKYFEQDELEVLSILKKTADEVFSGFSSYKLNIPDEKVFIRGNSQSVKNMFVDIFSFICSSIGDKGQVELNSVIEFNPVEMNGLGIATDNKFLLISLRERGFRIPGEILPKIFEPFVASKDISKCDIGLSFSYGVIKSLGGMISIEDDSEFDHKINIIIPIYNMN